MKPTPLTTSSTGNIKINSTLVLLAKQKVKIYTQK